MARRVVVIMCDGCVNRVMDPETKTDIDRLVVAWDGIEEGDRLTDADLPLLDDDSLRTYMRLISGEPQQRLVHDILEGRSRLDTLVTRDAFLDQLTTRINAEGGQTHSVGPGTLEIIGHPHLRAIGVHLDTARLYFKDESERTLHFPMDRAMAEVELTRSHTGPALPNAPGAREQRATRPGEAACAHPEEAQRSETHTTCGTCGECLG